MPTYKENFLEKIEVQVPKETDVPFILDDWTLAFRLGFTGKTLWYILKHRRELYREFMIKKKSGGLRRTFDPNDMMRLFQQQMRARILLPLCSKLGEHVSAYQVGKSTVDAARQHIRPCAICDETTRPGTSPVKHRCPRQGVKFKLDLKDFFLSTRRSWIRQYFHEVVGYNHYVSSLLAQLLTTDYVDERQRKRTGVPPGALTAGDICNLVANWKIDDALMKALPGWKYTRYADDLYFSHDKKLSSDDVNAAIKTAGDIIKESGYRVNWKKLHVQYWTRPQRFLGININRKLNVPAQEYRRMHNILYHAKKFGFEAQLTHAKKESLADLHAWITGKLNYFSQFAPEKTAKLRQMYADAKAAHQGETDAITMFEFKKGEVVPIKEVA